MPARTKPQPTVGIVGGGQLAKMTAQAAHPFGCEVVVLERQAEFPANSLDTRTILGDWDDPDRLLELAAQCDVVTLENEFVDARALAAVEAAGYRVRPGAATLGLVQDKLLQKQAFAAAGLPLAPFADAPDRRAVETLGARLGYPLVLKRRRNGYDGKGNATVRGPEDVAAAWTRLDGDRQPLYAEAFVRFRAELATIVVRGKDGTIVAYPVVETHNEDHICREVVAPARVAPAVAATVADVARRAVLAVDGVGAFGLETFLAEDGLVVVNEIAPRVHNSGHYTIEACACSQFENHLRAVVGWPLGPTTMRAPAAAMVNLLGVGEGPGAPHGLLEALAVPGAHVHVYGKTSSARGRKMGHVTALGATADEALAVARRAAGLLRFGDA
jgi:5-(carboxyamino)imidazole ribonucleotide synthase